MNQSIECPKKKKTPRETVNSTPTDGHNSPMEPWREATSPEKEGRKVLLPLKQKTPKDKKD